MRIRRRISSFNRRSESPSEGTRVELVAVLLGAVQHMHARSIVHRDIKPGNNPLLASPRTCGVWRLHCSEWRKTPIPNAPRCHLHTGNLLLASADDDRNVKLGDMGFATEVPRRRRLCVSRYEFSFFTTAGSPDVTERSALPFEFGHFEESPPSSP